MTPATIIAFMVTGSAVSPAVWALVSREVPDGLSGRTKAVVTVALALVCGVAAWRVEALVAATATAWALAAAVTVAAVDARVLRIPDRLVLPSLTVTVALFATQGLALGGPVARALAGAPLFLVILGGIHVLSPQKMGYGDVKLAALLGLPLGWQAWIAVPAALVIASVAGLVIHGVMVIAGRRIWADILPFGVYLGLGASVTIAIGGDRLGAFLRVG